MKNNGFTVLAFILLFGLFCFSFSCNNSIVKQDNNISTDFDFDSFRYEFTDSSVPPRFHRSYRIFVTPAKVSKLVHSYGDTITTLDKNMKPGDFERLKLKFKEAGIKKCDLGKSKGCTGGTGIAVECFNKKATVFSASLYRCGGKDYGTLCGDTEVVLAYLEKLLWLE